MALGSKLVALGRSLADRFLFEVREESDLLSLIFGWLELLLSSTLFEPLSGGGSESALDFLEVLVVMLRRSSSGLAPAEEEVEPAVLAPALFSTELFEELAKMRFRASR